MRRILMFFCFTLLLTALPAQAQETEWTAWIVTSVQNQPVVRAIRSDGTVATTLTPVLPEGYTVANDLTVSYTGRYLAYYVYEAIAPEPSEYNALVVYDTAELTFAVIYPMPQNFWSTGRLVFDEAETRFSFAYNTFDPATHFPNGWGLHVLDLQTGEVIAERIVTDDEDEPGCPACTPRVRRFVGNQLALQLTNVQIEDYANPLLWDISANPLIFDPAYFYFDLDVFAPTGEVVYARYDNRFPPVVDRNGTTDGPTEYWYPPNTLWVTQSGSAGQPFFTSGEWITENVTFIQNGERVLAAGGVRSTDSNETRFAIITRGGSEVSEYFPGRNRYPSDLTFADTPDGFLQLDESHATLIHVNTRGETPQMVTIYASEAHVERMHVQYAANSDNRGAWADITPPA